MVTLKSALTPLIYCMRGRPVFDAALSRSKQDSDYLQLPPISSLSFGRGVVRGLDFLYISVTAATAT